MERDGNRSRLAADYALLTMRAGDLGGARDLASLAREEEAQGLDALLASARIEQAIGNVGDALGYFAKAHETYPESRVALLGRIGLLAETGKRSDAERLLEDALRRSPGDADLIYLQARFAAEEEDWTKVRDLLQPLEARDDPAQQVLYARALLALDLGEQAQARLAPLVRRYPEAPAPRRLLAQAQLEAGDAAKAFATIAPLARSAGGLPSDIALFAEAARQSGKGGEITSAYSSAPPPERVAALLANADAALRDGRWRAAADAYEQLRGWTGDSNALVLNNLAYARSRMGQTQEAIKLAEKAHKLAPGNASIMDTLGWLLFNSGSDKRRGLELLEDAVSRAPANAAIAAHLAKAQAQ